MEESCNAVLSPPWSVYLLHACQRPLYLVCDCVLRFGLRDGRRTGMLVKSANKICAFYFHRTRELFSRGFLFIARFFVCIIGSYVDRPIGTGLGLKCREVRTSTALRASACLFYLQMGFSSDGNTKTFANEIDAPTRSSACRMYIFYLGTTCMTTTTRYFLTT